MARSRPISRTGCETGKDEAGKDYEAGSSALGEDDSLKAKHSQRGKQAKISLGNTKEGCKEVKHHSSDDEMMIIKEHKVKQQ